MAKSISELNRLYQDADACDSDLFSEQRTHVNLYQGDHFKKQKRYESRDKSNKGKGPIGKIRLQKDHINRISRLCINHLLDGSGDIVIRPKNPKELRDIKVSDYHNAVWEHIKETTCWGSNKTEWAKLLYVAGEAYCKTYWDNYSGEIISYDEEGRPIYSGQIIHELIFPWDLKRDPSAKTWKESRFVVINRMVDTDELRAMVGEDEEKQELITESIDETYKVFDGKSYRTCSNQTLVREFYFRPTTRYPNGWYAFTVSTCGVIFEGELPLGVFPISQAVYESIPTCPRGFSHLRILKTFQLEIDRLSTLMAQSQMTSRESYWVQRGSKTCTAGTLLGYRVLEYSGSPPIRMEGSTGVQYLPLLQQTIQEMYEVSGIQDKFGEKQGFGDPQSLMMRNSRQRKAFSLYCQNFERFVKDIAEKSLRLAKGFMQPNVVIAVAGRDEIVNIEEFKRTEDINYQIVLENTSDDETSRYGKQLALDKVIQYVGGNLSSTQLGSIIKNMPYITGSDIHSSLTVIDEIINNKILAIERGDSPYISETDPHEDVIRRLELRISEPSYRYLPQEVQELYKTVLDAHRVLLKQQVQQEQLSQQGQIPTTGPLVKVSLHTPSPTPTNPDRTRQKAYPLDALEWLDRKFTSQGVNTERFAGLSAETRAMLQPRPEQPLLGEVTPEDVGPQENSIEDLQRFAGLDPNQ